MPKVKQLKDTPTLDNYSVTKVVTMGNIIEVTSRKKNSFGCPCVKIDADHYCDLRTGELLQYSHIENRSQSLRSIKNTLSRVRSLVNTNITHPANVRWVTLT